MIIAFFLLFATLPLKRNGKEIRTYCKWIMLISLIVCIFSCILFYCYNCREKNEPNKKRRTFNLDLEKYKYYNLKTKIKQKIFKLLGKWEKENFKKRKIFLNYEYSIDEETQWIRFSCSDFYKKPP